MGSEDDRREAASGGAFTLQTHSIQGGGMHGSRRGPRGPAGGRARWSLAVAGAGALLDLSPHAAHAASASQLAGSAPLSLAKGG
jgi:hypothetical protein